MWSRMWRKGCEPLSSYLSTTCPYLPSKLDTEQGCPKLTYLQLCACSWAPAPPLERVSRTCGRHPKALLTT